jgi:hypothetical protein
MMTETVGITENWIDGDNSHIQFSDIRIVSVIIFARPFSTVRLWLKQSEIALERGVWCKQHEPPRSNALSTSSVKKVVPVGRP